MKTFRFATLAFAASLLSTPAVAQESPVLGTWNTQAVTDFGTFASTLTVMDDEGSYLVTMEDVPTEGMPAMEGFVSDVVLDGATFSFKRNLTSPQGDMELTYSGTVEGDNMTATATSPMGAIPVTGTRVQ